MISIGTFDNSDFFSGSKYHYFISYQFVSSRSVSNVSVKDRLVRSLKFWNEIIHADEILSEIEHGYVISFIAKPP